MSSPHSESVLGTVVKGLMLAATCLWLFALIAVWTVPPAVLMPDHAARLAAYPPAGVIPVEESTASGIIAVREIGPDGSVIPVRETTLQRLSLPERTNFSIHVSLLYFVAMIAFFVFWFIVH